MPDHTCAQLKQSVRGVTVSEEFGVVGICWFLVISLFINTILFIRGNPLFSI